MEIKQKQKRLPFSDRRLLCSWCIVCFVRHASNKKQQQINIQTNKQSTTTPPSPKKYLTKVKIPKNQHERALQNNMISSELCYYLECALTMYSLSWLS